MTASYQWASLPEKAVLTPLRNPITKLPRDVRWALGLFVFSIPFEMPHRTIPVELPTLTAVLFLVVACARFTQFFELIPSLLPWSLGYLYVAVASSVYQDGSHLPEVCWLGLQILLSVVLMWAGYNVFRYPGVLSMSAWAIVSACVVHSILVLARIGVTHSVDPRAAIGLFGQDRNYSTGILMIGFLIAAGTVFARAEPMRRHFRILAMAAAVIIALGIIRLGSRGAILALGSGVAIFAFKPVTLALRVRMAAVSMMIIGLLALAIMRSPEVSTRFEASFSSGDMTGREVLFPLAVKMFDERPWLGWGLGNNEYELASRLLQPDYRLVFASRDMHNVALQILTSSGVIGFFIFAAGFSYVALEAWRARTGPEGILPFALLMSTVVISMSLGWIASKMAWMLLAYPLVAGEAIRSRKRSTITRLSA